ncbi:hypothetical protein [Frateuria defendens]|uniref:hypothetical protein n=1 Tax=Frateuria defendens TaxID=2219559 RepID=UPI0012935290|nr:hypothetical protein [Frateuria defendens]
MSVSLDGSMENGIEAETAPSYLSWCATAMNPKGCVAPACLLPSCLDRPFSVSLLRRSNARP